MATLGVRILQMVSDLGYKWTFRAPVLFLGGDDGVRHVHVPSQGLEGVVSVSPCEQQLAPS